MFCVSAFLMATLLLFSTLPISLAQQNSIHAQAQADARADMSERSKAKWFLLGGLGSTAGCLIGCVGGFLLGGANFSNAPSNSQAYFGLTGSVLLGVCAVPIGAHMYPHNPTPPPPEQLLGKSPEYIQAYTHAYKSRTVLLRKRFVTAGSIASNLGVAILAVRFGLGH